jgi:polyhydroxyalkanoate synthesis regulator phasin
MRLAPESAQERVDDLLLRIKGLVHVRAILEDRGASYRELHEHTLEIERLRAQLAELVKESAA